MLDRIVVNASPVIFLSRVGGLTWLGDLAIGGVEIPRGVVQEITVGEDGQGIIDAMQATPRIRLVDDCAVPLVIAAWDLGKGETQVLAHCLKLPGALAVLDDGAARQCARSLGIPLAGTLGVVLAAKRMGWIAAARPVVERLIRDGLYLSPSLMADALQEVGE
ncbi:MAG: DUF3368 domain-containing protein [Lamprocystis purpurea]|uniref:DUF3368 domain-containing protein n=1 Tax=Lamprocystis purpurea TaxID=61598 RepID=UPI00039EABDE|nr:DUF3368 domain-containing protein [Lamprocystis purpurea]MBV5272629.1 DUF3368 domain-containing protein [Lamprocystis purpurea]